MTNITDFNNIIDFDKIVLVEWRVGWEIPLMGWTLDSYGAYYYALPGYIGEIVKIEESGVDYTRESSYADLIASGNTGAFFHDLATGELYIRMEGDDDPATTGYFLIVFFWLAFVNSQHDEFIVGFAPRFGEVDGATEPIFYWPFLDVASIPAVSQSVADYWTGALQIQFGGLAFLNNGQWWKWKNYNILFHHKDVWIKIGEKGSEYDDFVTVFPGTSLQPTFSDAKTTLQIKDRRAAEFREIPIDRFSTNDYANLEEDAEGRPIPILFGEKEDITPVCIDTANHIYKITQTIFNSVNYPQQETVDVFKDEVELNVGAADDYTVDLANGQFTLAEDPEDANITVRAKGIKCQYDFSSSDPSTPTGVYSTNIADILYFMLHELLLIPHDRIDGESFADLKTKRTQIIAWYLEAATASMDFVRILQASAIFHLIPKLDASYLVRCYDRDTPADTLMFENEDYSNFRLLEDTKTNFRNVTLRYDKKPSVDEWKIIAKSIDESFYKHQQEETLPIDTALRDDTEADGIADFYLALIENPGDKIKTGLPPGAMDLIPTDKIIISRSVIDDEDQEILNFEEEVFVLLSIQKSIASARSNVVALRDTQAQGISIHADVAHVDTHGDSYSDAGHVDVAHVDTHGDSHGDIEHQDSYIDTPHEDAHSDSHQDESHGFYTDHPDIIYTDQYTDSYTDTHSDVAHEDEPPYNDHTDTHTDWHTDTHSDVPHEDGHGDIYTDEHGDQAHVDSEI